MLTPEKMKEDFAEAKRNGKIPKGQTGFFQGMNIQNPEHLILEKGALCFEVMGGVNLKQLDRLKVTLSLSRFPMLSSLHVIRHTLDLYNNGQVKSFIRNTAEQLELGTNDVRIPIYDFINTIEAYRLDKRQQMLLPTRPKEITLNPKAIKEAKNLLNDKNLLSKIAELLKTCGLVNEETNGLLLFNIFLTRFFDKPLHAVVHGTSGSGKTNLLKTVIATVPDEQKHVTTSLTENVLFYPPYKNFWSHKILMLEDLDGSATALYALRELASNGSVSKFTVEMDQGTGEHRQKQLEAKGPVCIVGATTKEKIYEDNSNRSFLIHINESKKHQQDVMQYQNAEAAGLIDKEARNEAAVLLQNMQRLLEKVNIINPFQPELMLPDIVFKPLRTNQHYISLIKAITFLHQYQRKTQKDKATGKSYIETTLDDIEIANRLSRDSLLRKSDQLTGRQRVFFEALKGHLKKQGVEQDISFFGKDIRKAFSLHPQACQRNFSTLESRGLIEQVNYSKKQGYEYRISSWEDYETIKNSISTMDEKLAELREKYPGA
ncbi:MAG: type IV secretion system DNA-binding domain-containing protein [Crocinitomicaceae bacterium]